MKTIDLRSDTVTLPTPEMREAMARADLGDDVFGEDPTLNRLEAMSAERLGKDAALFVTSGTMGNLVALLVHCGRGDEVILGHLCHTYLFEQGGIAALGGITPWPIPNQEDGTLRVEDVESAIRGDNVHFPRTRAVCLENTHNMCNGAPLTAEYTAKIARLAHARKLRVHLDGARIFNAATALGTGVKELVRDVDSVTFCLSKGLSAPVGSVLCGRAPFIAEARRVRKVLGGGMRQGGVLAAAGIVALEQIADRLDEDHARARRLAEGLTEIHGLCVAPVWTNIIFFRQAAGTKLGDAEAVAALERRGIRIMGGLQGRFRAVTHQGISDADIETALTAMREVFAGS